MIWVQVEWDQTDLLQVIWTNGPPPGPGRMGLLDHPGEPGGPMGPPPGDMAGPDGPMGPPPGDTRDQTNGTSSRRTWAMETNGPMGPPPGDMGDQWDLLQVNQVDQIHCLVKVDQLVDRHQVICLQAIQWVNQGPIQDGGPGPGGYASSRWNG